jgi:hypothetical protein
MGAGDVTQDRTAELQGEDQAREAAAAYEEAAGDGEASG